MRNWILYFLLGSIFFALPITANAQVELVSESVTFSWKNPTQNSKGQPYDAATEQAGARIYCNLDAAAFTPQTPFVPAADSWTGEDIPAVPQTDIIYSHARDADTSTTEELFYDTYKCYATVITKKGVESRLSNSTLFVLGAPIPPPPKPTFEDMRPMPPTLLDTGA